MNDIQAESEDDINSDLQNRMSLVKSNKKKIELMCSTVKTQEIPKPKRGRPSNQSPILTRGDFRLVVFFNLTK